MEESTTNGANGVAQAEGPDSKATISPIDAKAAQVARRAAARESFLRSVEGGEPEKPAASEPEKEPDTEETDAPADAEDEPQEAAEDTEEVAAEDDSNKETDPDTQKRIAAVQRAERRSRDAIAAKEAEFTERVRQFESHWGPKVEGAKKFEEAQGRLHDVVGLLLSVGYAPEDLEYVSHQAYAASAKGKEDPRVRDAANQSMRERELRTQAAEANRRVAELEKRLDERDRMTAAERDVEPYLGELAKAVTESAPLVQRKLAKNAANTRITLHTIAVELAEETGSEFAPDPAAVVKEYEKRLRAELEELGGSYPATGKVAPNTKTKTTATNTQKAPPKELGKKSPQAPRAMSREELRKQFIEKGTLG